MALFSKDLGIDLESVKLTDLGRAKRIHITSDTTTIVDGAGSKDTVGSPIVTVRFVV